MCSGWVGLATAEVESAAVWSGCYVVSLTWPLCTTYSQAGGRSDLRQGVSLTRRLRRYETVEHLGECEGLKEVYTSLRKLDEKGEWRQPKLNLLGVSEKDGGLHEPLERGISAVHTIVWREMIGEITRVDTDGRRFSAQATLTRAKRRCVERMHAFEQQVANYTLRKEAKGEDPTDG